MSNYQNYQYTVLHNFKNNVKNMTNFYLDSRVAKHLLLFLSIMLVISACKDEDNGIYLAYDLKPAATYIKSRSDLSLWGKIIDKAGLGNTLNLNGTYTCFVPTDSAVEVYLKENNYSSVDDISAEGASELIKYHTLDVVELYESSFTSGVLSYATVSGEYLSLVFGDGGLNSIYLNGEARLVELDIEATNAVIHVINKVLDPITETIYQKISNGKYSIFKDAIDAIGYSDTLNTITQVVNTGTVEIVKNHFTVFAIPDSIYNSLGISSLSELISNLGISATDYTSKDNGLNKYVLYHILSQNKSYSDLSTFDDGETSANYNTLADGELLSCNEVNGTLYINYDTINYTGVGFVKTDINCKNGIVHAINKIMPVTTPYTTKVLWDLTDYSDLESLCTIYQGASSSAYTLTLSEDEVSCYSWVTVPEGKSGAVKYYTIVPVSGYTYLNSKAPYLYDYLILNLGTYGYIDITSPSILKGKYKISLTYFSPKKTSDYGIVSCYMDGAQVGSNKITLSNTTSDTYKTVVLTSSIEFTKTTTHVFRAICMDGNICNLDYITLTPVN